MKLFLQKIKCATISSSFVIHLFDKVHSMKGRKRIMYAFFWVGVCRLIVDLFVRKKRVSQAQGLAIVTIIKDEAPYIEEWLKYHQAIGVKKFYIYDNDSSDDTHELLLPYINAKIVEYSVIHGPYRQMDAYNLALRKYGKRHKYLAFIDIDEFFVSNSPFCTFVDEFFSKIQNAGGLAVNWALFGSSGYRSKPKGKVTENYLHRGEKDFEKNRHIKTVCIPQRVWGFLNPHFAIYKKKFAAYTVSGEKVEGPFTENVDWSGLRLNHYCTKSYEEFCAKRNKGRADSDADRADNDFAEHDVNDVLDDEMLRFWASLQE